MEELKKLQDIGAKDISKSTHIALNKVQCILDKNFLELKDYATTCGLLQILEREYRISLAQWLDEYVEFWKTYDGNAQDLPQVSFKVTHETPMQNDSKKGVLLGALIVILLAVAFYTYINITQDEKTQEPAKIESKAESKAEAKVESKEQTQDAQSPALPTMPQAVQEKVESETTEPQKEIPTTEANISTNATAENSLEQIAQTNNANALNENLTQEKKVTKVEIVPGANVWIGIVYLDTRKRMSLVTEKPLEINLSRPQTIITGHGNLQILSDGNAQVFNSADKMLFFVDENGNFSEISQKDYDIKTRGLKW